MRFRDIAVRTPKHTCWYQQGKICYDKKGAISAKNLRYKQDKIKLRAYWCNKCNFWHLTKQFINNFMSDEQTQPAPEVTVTDLPADNQPVETPASTEATPA